MVYGLFCHQRGPGRSLSFTFFPPKYDHKNDMCQRERSLVSLEIQWVFSRKLLDYARSRTLRSRWLKQCCCCIIGLMFCREGKKITSMCLSICQIEIFLYACIFFPSFNYILIPVYGISLYKKYLFIVYSEIIVGQGVLGKVAKPGSNTDSTHTVNNQYYYIRFILAWRWMV